MFDIISIVVSRVEIVREIKRPEVTEAQQKGKCFALDMILLDHYVYHHHSSEDHLFSFSPPLSI